MKPRLERGLASVLACLLLAEVPPAWLQAQSPQMAPPMFESPPPTLEEFWKYSPAVVLLKVQQSRPRALTEGRLAHPYTEHDVQVLEVLKDDGTRTVENTAILTQVKNVSVKYTHARVPRGTANIGRALSRV